MTPASQIDLATIRILDGGMATELEKLGCDLSGPLWSAHVLREQPEKIAAVHAGYLAAGADCILTASYQVSAEAYAEIGLSPEDAAASLRESVRIAEDVRAGFSRSSPRRDPDRRLARPLRSGPAQRRRIPRQLRHILRPVGQLPRPPPRCARRDQRRHRRL